MPLVSLLGCQKSGEQSAVRPQVVGTRTTPRSVPRVSWAEEKAWYPLIARMRTLLQALPWFARS